jgi:hypothetical protein
VAKKPVLDYKRICLSLCAAWVCSVSTDPSIIYEKWLVRIRLTDPDVSLQPFRTLVIGRREYLSGIGRDGCSHVHRDRGKLSRGRTRASSNGARPRDAGRHRQGSRSLSGFPHSLERRRRRHPYTETSQGGIHEAAISEKSCPPCCLRRNQASLLKKLVAGTVLGRNGVPEFFFCF